MSTASPVSGHEPVGYNSKNSAVLTADAVTACNTQGMRMYVMTSHHSERLFSHRFDLLVLADGRRGIGWECDMACTGVSMLMCA